MTTIKKIKRKYFLIVGGIFISVVSFVLRSSSSTKEASLFVDNVYADVASYDQTWVNGLGEQPCGGCSAPGTDSGEGGFGGTANCGLCSY